MKQLLKLLVGQGGASSKGSAAFWTQHNVTLHESFSSAEESLEYLKWRNDQYFGYLELMPVPGYDNCSVLDYGCGPGNDLVGFGVYSAPSRIVGIEVSPSSLAEATRRVALHGLNVELVQLDPASETLPFESGSFDHIHSSGVLHHTPNPQAILSEFRRVLRPGGSVNIMVYNYDSLWMHLYVAYERSIVQGLYAGESLREQFRRSTDGDDCPISNCYRAAEWIAICAASGLTAVHVGNAVSAHEMSLLPKRFAAIQDRRLRPESRQFLARLSQDADGLPTLLGQRAGIDACYRAVAT